MRTGQYAVVDGVEYRAHFRDELDTVEVTVDPGLQPPADSTVERLWDGTVVARVPRARASRLYEIETWALLYGRFPVQVDRIDPDGTAAVAMPVYKSTPVGELNRPGSGGGSQSMEDESHGSTEEVPRRVA